MRAVCGAAMLVVALVNPINVAVASKDTVTIAQGTDLTTGDPQRSGFTPDFNVLSNIYETLINRDAAFHLTPGLARSWTQIDPTTWEFTLRPGVRFHDGEPLTAEAVKFSIERGMDPQLHWVRARWFPPIHTITVVDTSTVRITTTVPVPATRFLREMSVNSWILPPDYLKKNGDTALVRHPVGTGPYKFVQWVRDDHIELEANPDYWGGRPKIGHVIVRDIPTDSARLAELLAGSVDLINLIPPELFDPIEHSSNAQVVQGTSLSPFFVTFNLVNIPSGRPLADKRVRQALNYAVARKALLTTIMHNAGAPIATFCTTLQFGCDPSIPGWPYDPDRAKALLAAAGFSNGFDMTNATTSGVYPGDLDLTLAVADQLSRVGVRVHPVVVEYGVLLQRLVTKKLDTDAILLRYTSYYGDAGEIASFAFTRQGGASSWSPADPEFERLLDDAGRSLDDAKAKASLRQAQQLFKSEPPAIPLFTAPNAYGESRDLDWTPRPDLFLLMGGASWR